MPFVLAIVGITLLVTALRGTTGTLFSLIKSDFTGSGNYIWWVVSILVIGSVGYVKRLQPIVNMFILLILVVMFIGAGKKGFFAQFTDALKNPATNCGASSGMGVISNQLASTPPTVLATPGQSTSQAISNGWQNFNSALGNSSTLFGG